MDLDEFDLEDDILDYERSPSPCEQVHSPEADEDAKVDDDCDFGSINQPPTSNIRSPKFSTGIGEPFSEQHLDASTLQAKINPSKPVCSPKFVINLESLVISDSAETRSKLTSPTEAVESSAPPLPVLRLHSHDVSANRTEHGTAAERTTHCPPKVAFSPSSLIFTGSSQEGNENINVAVPESNFDIISETLGNSNPAERPRMVTTVCFDPSSLLEKLSVSGSDDELQVSPTDNQTDSLDQRTINSNSSGNSGFQAAVNEVHAAPIGGLRGILKYKNPLISNNEKIVAHCLKLLCQPENDEKHQGLSSEYVMWSSAREVFKNLCFDQFFQKGECFSSTCDDNHHYKSHIFCHSNEEMWNASLYVICHSAMPNLHVVENLVQHYTAQGNMSHALLFAKCVAKVKDADRLELAHFIVNKLSSAIPARDVITVILMLNFSDLSSITRYNQLMEGLGVFEQNTTHYSELMAFLNFRKHKMPARSLCKLMKDSMKYSCEDSWVESVTGFLKRLHPAQKEEIQPIANDFEEQFGVLSVTDNLNHNQVSEYDEPHAKRSKTGKKKVSFAADPDVREFEVADSPKVIQCEVDPLEVNFSDEECGDDDQPDIPNFYGSSDTRAERLSRVFAGSCHTWILNGQCSNADCSLTHDFNKDSLANFPSEDVFVAADYIITQSQTPSIEILKIFIEFLAESKETARVLSVRKCTVKMSTVNGLRLTKLVMTLLAKQMSVWEAIEKVLVPDAMEPYDLEDGHFIFDKGLLCFIMSEAIKSKTTVLKCVTRAIMQQITKLPPSDNAEMVHISSYYIQKFVMAGTELPQFPDILPVKRIEPNAFASHLKVALYQGVSSKYFLAATLMKQAVHGCLRDQAFDVLYTFLLSNFDRARVLTHLLEKCNYFDATTNKSVREFFGTVGLTTSIRLYENENFAGTAELLNVLKKFKLNIFTLFPSRENMTEFNLAIIYCSVTVGTVNRNDAIDIFLNRCVDSCLNSDSSVCPPDLIKLTSKMFQVFTSALLVEESLKLFKGIVARQKSLVSPLNIVEFVEPTLRCTLNRPCDTNIRKESLKLYLEVVDSETPVTLQKVTHRSMFLIALMEIIQASQKFEVKGHINIIHPLVKKMLLICINEEAYVNVSTPQIILYSSMTAKEIEVYLMWWFFLYVRARKRQAFDYFNPITVKIVQDCIQDDSRLPVHPSLRNVSASITECTERVALVIKNVIAEPMSVITSRERGVFELHPATTRALSQTSSNIMLQHGYIHPGKDRMCTFCLDSVDVKLADKL